ncbi:MAG TPA: MFS transporter [Candidatus Limnocylindrales bacterium]|nr:MFS transporter [Candidatus Limnocylindrales bacterium]
MPGKRAGVNPWIIAMTVMLATFMEVLDTSVANVSLPNIAGSLSASVDEATWVLTSYLVANAIILPMGGWFSMLLGRKRFYMICVGLFTVSSFLCGLAPSLTMLIVFRIARSGAGRRTARRLVQLKLYCHVRDRYRDRADRGGLVGVAA